MPNFSAEPEASSGASASRTETYIQQRIRQHLINHQNAILG